MGFLSSIRSFGRKVGGGFKRIGQKIGSTARSVGRKVAPILGTIGDVGGRVLSAAEYIPGVGQVLGKALTPLKIAVGAAKVGSSLLKGDYRNAAKAAISTGAGVLAGKQGKRAIKGGLRFI